MLRGPELSGSLSASPVGILTFVAAAIAGMVPGSALPAQPPQGTFRRTGFDPDG